MAPRTMSSGLDTAVSVAGTERILPWCRVGWREEMMVVLLKRQNPISILVREPGCELQQRPAAGMVGNLIQNGTIKLPIRTEQHAGSKISPVPALALRRVTRDSTYWGKSTIKLIGANESRIKRNTETDNPNLK